MRLKTSLTVCLYSVCMLMTGVASASSPKVQICHLPQGNLDNYHTITISVNALPAHLAHGDLGEPCNAVCAVLCDDGDACTIDDTGDCEQRGCPVTSELVNCNDENGCTADSCSPIVGCVNTPVLGAQCDDGQLCSGPDTCNAQGACVGELIDNCCLGDEDCSQNPCDQASCNLQTNRCGNNPVVCNPPNLCTISLCAPDNGACVDSPIICGEGEECNPDTGECEAVSTPCWTEEEIAKFAAVATNDYFHTLRHQIYNCPDGYRQGETWYLEQQTPGAGIWAGVSYRTDKNPVEIGCWFVDRFAEPDIERHYPLDSMDDYDKALESILSANPGFGLWLTEFTLPSHCPQ